MITKGEEFLIIEDDHEWRDIVMKSMHEAQINNVEAPASVTECERLLAEKKYHAAFVDLRLNNWVEGQEARPIILGEKERRNGLDIATYLSRKYPNMLIGMYSTNEGDLKDKFQKAQLASTVYVASQKAFQFHNIEKFLPTCVSYFLDFDIEVSPIRPPSRPYTQTADVYLGKKLLNIPGPGNFLWKNGEFAWRVLSNKKYRGEEQVTNDSLGPDAKISQYQLKVNREKLCLESFETEGISIKKDERDLAMLVDRLRDEEPSFTKTLSEIVASNFICGLFLEGEIKTQAAAKLMLKLSFPIQILSQKHLFVHTSDFWGFNGDQKGERNRLLSFFVQQGLPGLVDVFHATVEKVNGSTAYVNLESKGVEGASRVEPFKSALLEEYGIVENSRFEYTVFKQAGGTTGYNIEPI